MSRFYFYHANWYSPAANEQTPSLEGETHGIWIVEDSTTPDTILASIENWLYEEWEKQRAAAQQPASSVSYVITQFNNVQ